ncbi:MAG: Lrp/AsnC family transcriptional regulator [Chloroflexi bacterium]|nr:Lrp/AsnC family transcriptional regulator [Chloroflexota bacterium]
MTILRSADFDQVDRQILSELQRDARLTQRELGSRVGLTGPAVAERVRRLEERGAIVGYRAVVCPEALGYGIQAYVNIALDRNVRGSDVGRALAQEPEVVECHHITGEDCYLLRVCTQDARSLSRLIDRLTTWGRTRTSLILGSPIVNKPVLPAENGVRSLRSTTDLLAD